MSIINNGLLLASGADAAVGYQISRSLRFNSADSAYLSRTPGSAGNRNTWTFSCWFKIGAEVLAGTSHFIIFTDSTFNTGIMIRKAGVGNPLAMECFCDAGATLPLNLVTTQVFRDPSAWYHLVWNFDLANATQADRSQIWINGSRITSFATNINTISTSSGGRDINNTVQHRIGGVSTSYAGGYMADIYFLDGTATTPSTFAETDAITGQWVPKAYTGSYGTNGFRLTFSDNSGTTSTTLGKDAAGSNNFTPNNFSVASGSGNDSLTDSPTSYGTDTGAGGEVRGNYATLNPLNNAGASGTYSNGNLEITTGSSQYGAYVSTIATPTSGKWYAEAYITSGANTRFGFVKASYTPSSTEQLGNVAGTMAYRCDNGDFRVALTTKFTGGATCTSGDTVGLALDNDNGEVKIYKNGSLQGTATGIEAANWCFAGSDDNGAGTATHIWNFGQRQWAYAPPSGFRAICDTNLTSPTIAKPANYFDVKTYSGNGGTQSITGLAFSPSLVWYKSRNNVGNNALFDAVRGATKRLVSNDTAAEDTRSGVTSFDSNGWTEGSFDNQSGYTYVGWAWLGASSNSTNTSGTITSTVRANATAGFSIVTYTGNNTANATFGHGLGATPEFVIIKKRSTTGNWIVYHKGMTSSAYYMYLNATDAQTNQGGAVNTWGVSSTLITLKELFGDYNANGATYVAYCFAPVAGYSAFGSYTGNGSSDGPFVFTGFRPRWVMIKCSSSAQGGNSAWMIVDAVRNTYNAIDYRLHANLSDSEYTNSNIIDFTANGFKLRTAPFAVTNTSAETYVWAAFAESPFQYARAR